jgi:hypothetical protein
LNCAGGKLMLWITNSEISASGRALKLGEGQWCAPLHQPVAGSNRM